MPRQEPPRQLQARLAQQLHDMPAGQAPAWLAAECAGVRLLLPLDEVGEIVEHAPPLLPLPHARPWFEGVLNLRGRLHGVVDLAAFLGLRPTGAAPAATSRLVALHPSLGLHCLLRVDLLAGLRNASQLAVLPAVLPPGSSPGAAPAFAGDLHDDGQGRTWQALRLAALARDAHFLHVAQPLPGSQ